MLNLHDTVGCPQSQYHRYNMPSHTDYAMDLHYLESCSLRSKLLILQHGLQHLPVTSRHQAHGSQDFQDSNFGLDVFCAEALGDGVDACWVCQYMGSSILQNSSSSVPSVLHLKITQASAEHTLTLCLHYTHV